MLNIGAGEIAVILVVALLVLGPKRLPELARVVGKFVREFRRQTDEVRSTLETEFYRMDQDLLREDVKPIAAQDASGQLPAITGPLDGGRRVSDELDAAYPRGAHGEDDGHGGDVHGHRDDHGHTEHDGHGGEEHGPRDDSGHSEHDGHGEDYGPDAYREQGEPLSAGGDAADHDGHARALRRAAVSTGVQPTGQVIPLDPAAAVASGAPQTTNIEADAALSAPLATGTGGTKDGHS